MGKYKGLNNGIFLLRLLEKKVILKIIIIVIIAELLSIYIVLCLKPVFLKEPIYK
jgi:hypothetical protein